jgi:hypothetical protein
VAEKPLVGSTVLWDGIVWTVEPCDWYEGHVHLVPTREYLERFWESRHAGWPCSYNSLDLLDDIAAGKVKPVPRSRPPRVA